jgi:hypothetical protein
LEIIARQRASSPGTRRARSRPGRWGIDGAFATLAPLVRDYLRERVFERPVDLSDKIVLRRLAEKDAQQLVIGASQQATLR